MTHAFLTRARSFAVKILKNPHFWVVVVLAAALLVVYQAWPWREWQFTQGGWQYFPWLSKLNYLVINVEMRFRLFGVLFLIPIIYGSLSLSWPGGAFAYCMSLIWVVPKLHAWGREAEPINYVLFLLPVLLVAIVGGERRARESEKRHFTEREQERQAYIYKLVEAQEGERQRISQELHDETLQTLMVIANKSDALSLSSLDKSQAKGNQWIKQQVLQTMDDLRRLSLNLRPSILDNFGLSFRHQVAGKQQQHAERLPREHLGSWRRARVVEVGGSDGVPRRARGDLQHAAARACPEREGRSAVRGTPAAAGSG